MDRAAFETLDRDDPLRPVRERFLLPPDIVYLDGNSLGALPSLVVQRLSRTIRDEWGRGLIRSWNDADWVGAPQRVAARIAPLIGADADEVAVCDSTTVDLFKLVVAAARLRPDRPAIVTVEDDFPTDRYVVDGVADLLGLQVRNVTRADLGAAIDDDVAAVVASHVDYRSGYRHDAAALTATAERSGALLVWDLSHSTGAAPVDLHSWRADLAVGCTYKYLNGGPGSPAYLYVSRRLLDAGALSPIAGWFGHAEPFAFDDRYAAAGTAQRFLAGTPPILSTLALEAALEVWEGVPLDAVHHKARALTGRFIELADDHLAPLGAAVVTPRDPEARGAHVSLRHDGGYPVMRALIGRGVIGDFRPPDLLRFGFAPLTTRYVDVWDAVETLRQVLEGGAWRGDHRSQPGVP